MKSGYFYGLPKIHIIELFNEITKQISEYIQTYRKDDF